jgi:phosphatidylinositol alpha-1,6-mannosyltransferase
MRPAADSVRTGAAGTILLLTEVFPPRHGGSGRWLWELYRRLEGVTVHVAAGQTPDAERFDEMHDLPIRRLPLHFSNWGVWDVRGAAQYARALPGLAASVARARPDIIHCGKCLPEGPLALLVKATLGVPFYCYVHGEELTLASTSNELRRLTRRVLRRATRVIANSRHTEQILRRDWLVPGEKIVVMHPGVDTKRFVPVLPNRSVRERLGWADRRVVLTVGALQKRKGQDMLIRALPIIRQQCPDVLYAIAGEGWEREYLERLVVEHGVGDLVQFRGIPADDELIDCYQQCDLFALPNRQVGWDFEGFGIVLLEAQACGRPVIAGLSGGAPETVSASETGELVTCESAESVARAVVALLTDPNRANAMGRRGRQWVVERFDWDVLTKQAVTLFSDAITP